MSLRLQIHWLILLGIVFFPIGITAQKSFQNYSSATLDSLSYDLFYKRQYNASLYYNLEWVDKLKSEVGEKDTLYLEAMELVALSHYFLGDYEFAEKNLQNLLDIQAKERGKNNDLYLDLLYVQLAVLTQMEKEAAASQIEVQLPNLWKNVGAEKCEKNYTDLMDFISTTHNHLGQYEQEERLYLLLKKYWKKKEGVEGEHYLITLSNLANNYLTTDRNEAGLQLLLQVLETRERLEPIPSESYIEDLRQLAVNYGHNGKDDEAERLFKKAALLCEKHLGKNHPEYGWICQKRADFYTYLNREKEAIALYQTANQIFEKAEGKLSSGYTFSLNNMARAYARLEQFDKAEKTLLEALQLKEQIYGKKHTEYFYTLNTLAGLYLQKNDPKMALKYDLKGFVCLSSTWDTLPELTDKFLSEIPDASFISTHFTFGALVDLLTTFNVFYDQHKEPKWLEKTYLLCQSALKYSEKTKNALANENDQLEILTYYNYFSKFGVWAAYKLSELSNKVQAETYSKAAFSFTEQNKAVVLAGALKAEQATQMSDIPAELAFQEKRLKEELGELKKQLMEIADGTKKSAVRTQFTEKSKELDVLKKTLEKDYPDYYDLKYSNHISSVKDIQTALPEKTLCIAYQIGKKVSYIFGLTKTDFFVIQKDTLSKQIKIHTEQLRKNLSDYSFIHNNNTLSYNQFSTSAHWFYNNLLQPALAKCKDSAAINKLIIIPDGELGHLPFEVFLVEPAPTLENQDDIPNYNNLHYLLKDYTVSYSYSASLWVINAEMTPREGNHRMLGMAAMYSKDSIDNEIAKERGDYLTQLRRSLFPLPAAQEEVQSLAASFKGDFFYGNDVNESFFRTQAQHYSIIHLAMHGILDNKTPILSGLLFTENKDKTQNNFLQAYEIAHLKLDAELVVLSACETGYGQFQQGEGVMSLARSFMYAGVPSLVVSMWKVNDHSTAVIMKFFYENLNKGMDKAESLRQAKLSYLKFAKGVAAHPSFWSPFIQFGNSSPLQLQGKGFGWWWFLVGVIVLVLGGIFIFKNKAKKMIKNTVVLWVLCFLTNGLIAQNMNKMSPIQLDSVCKVLQKQDKYAEIIPYAQKMLEQTITATDSMQFISLYWLAESYFGLDQSTEAESFYLKTIAAIEKKGAIANPIYADAVNQLGLVYQKMNDFESAEKYHLRAIDISRKNNRQSQASHGKKLYNLANLYINTGRYEEAEPLCLAAKEIFLNTLGAYDFLSGSVLNSLATLNYNLGRFETAEKLYMQAVQVQKKVLGEEHPRYVSILNNLASLYAQTKRLKEAERNFLKVIELRKKILGEQHPAYANSLNNLALVYQDMEQFEKSEALFLTANELTKKNLGPDHLQYANGLWNLARLYASTKKFDKAIQLYLQSNDIYKKHFGEQSFDYISTLNGLMNLYFEKGDLDKAMDYYKEAIRLNLNTKEVVDVSNITALSNYEYLFSSQVLLSFNSYYMLKRQRYFETKDKNYLLEAYTAMQVSTKISESIRQSFLGDEDKLRNLEGLNDIINHAITAGESMKNPTYYPELFSFAELNKSILLTDATKADRARNMSDLPDSLASKEVELQRLLDELKIQEMEAPTPEDKASVTNQINETNLQIDAFKKQLETNFPKYYKLKYQNITASAKEIQDLLDEKTLFLEYFISDSAIFLFALSKKDIQIHVYEKSISKKILTAKIQDFRDALTNYNALKNPALAYQNYTKTAFWFYENLIKKALVGKTQFKNLIIVTDGELGHLPFEAFLTKPATEQSEGNYADLDYLMKDYNISYNYSATLWKENHLSPSPQNNQQILACAASYTDDFKPKNRAAHLVELRKGLMDLPAAKEEVVGLSNLLSGNFWTAAASNEADFKKQASEYSVIHLAMHGLLNQQHPILSSLAFTDNGDSLQDNFLQAYEIAHLKLNADLVVLSACETGYGKFQQGEGVMSLARSFMYAGVPSLVVSLWQVNDHSTAVIMQSFYQHLAGGMAKDAALRQAKLDYIQKAQGIAGHPAFWSAFIQLGDSRPMQVETQFIVSKTWWGIGSICLLILGIAGIAWRKRKV